MTDREVMQMALNALKNTATRSAAEQYATEQNAIAALEAALAQPEQEEPLPLVYIGVDVTPEGTHVVACYNRPDAVQEMFYSQFHPLAKPEKNPVRWFQQFGDTQPEQEPKPAFTKFVISNEQYEIVPTTNALTQRIESLEAEVKCEEKRFNDLWDKYAALGNQKPWIGLTDDEKTEAIKVCKAPWHSHAVDPLALCNYVEQKLKDKNEL